MKVWIYRILIWLGLLLFCALVWFAFPLVGFGTAYPFEATWVRITIILVVLLIFSLVYGIKFLRRRKAAKALEESLLEPQDEGDGEVLSEKMASALDVLKKSSGGKSYLYDLPWYVIIGPPGAGKTTALLNSGIKMPLAGKDGGGAVAGVGGTRYCDWWFTEEAVMIDTAGRYTTQDSDADSDNKSWFSFLNLLKSHRPNQPINGVILAISLEEVMGATPEALQAHADTIRARLQEIHEQLKIEFPVYVLFTKADLIAGFMEYFGSFSESRRRKVWGATFQTENRKEQTFDRVPEEFDLLVRSLSEEVTDRLTEEPDGVSRIAIFGFPGQVGMLKDKVSGLLKGIFEPTRYKINASLRGFYFSSGTQEGTPIDQVLGAMERSFGQQSAVSSFSGKGKSFFLHDLLSDVIFGESGWVSFDRGAVRRSNLLRVAAFTTVTLATLTMVGLWGWSFYQNRIEIQTASAALADYEIAAKDHLQSSEISDSDVLEIAGLLQTLREMPLGYDSRDDDTPFLQGFGLSQRSRMISSSTTSYRQALERLFRSRLILRLEQQLQEFTATSNTLAIYEGLKVYKLLGDVAPRPDDQLIIKWFREDWRTNIYPGPQNAEARVDLEEHLTAMLELDGAYQTTVELDSTLIDEAEKSIARMNVADQAYSLIKATSEFAEIEPFSIPLRSGPDADLVFETVNGDPLSDQVIPALYTYAGFHDFFLPQLGEIAEKLSEEQWVMGEYAAVADIDAQLGRLGPQLLTRYTDEFIENWDNALGNIKLKAMAADKPAYRTLGAASAPTTSPILLLAEAISNETQLTKEFEEGGEGGGGGDALDGVGGEIGGALANRLKTRAGALGRIGIDFAVGKSQRRAGNASGGGGAAPLPGANIEAQFRGYHTLMEGDVGQRGVDKLIETLNGVHQALIVSVTNPTLVSTQMPILLGNLKASTSRLPQTFSRVITEAVEDFEGDAANSNVAQLNRDLQSQVVQICDPIVANNYPFFQKSQRDVPTSQFARLFAPDGVMDRFFFQNLARLADVGGTEWKWNQDSPLGSKLSPSALKQFQRASEIRDAFFPGGGGMPALDVTVSQSSIHNRIREATLGINGQVIKTRKVGNTPQSILWPSAAGGGSVTLQFKPNLPGRGSELAFQGPWALMRFINAGSPKPLGNGVQVRHTIGGRGIGYDLTVNSIANPFYLRALSEFRCPSGL